LHEGPSDTGGADLRHFAIARKNRRHRRRTRSNENQGHFEVVFLKQSGFLSNIGTRLRHHPRRVNEVEPVGRDDGAVIDTDA
jgi:hypothetical protein